MYSGEFHLDLCRDCEVDGLKAEIERLKTELAQQNECHIRTIKQNEDTYQGLQEAARKEIERLKTIINSIRPASEDKSGMKKPKTGARAPITKRNRVSKN